MTRADVPEPAAAPEPAAVREALRGVRDPEVGLDVVALGLVYGIEIEGRSVRVRHTLTTRGCPMEAVLGRSIRAAVEAVPGVEEVQTDLVWEPAWNAGMIDGAAW